MNRDEIERTLIDEIDRIAPGSVPPALDPTADLRECCDLDSMDVLNLLTALNESLGINIPEADLDQLVSLDSAVNYIQRRLSA